MRIKEVSCDQFAGLSDKEFEFDKGLNIVVGENESGKSTLVDLIYNMFFQDAYIDGRRDKAFKDRYFPKNAGQYQGDAIDGAVRFETSEGKYKLSKEWSAKGGQCRLVLPDGTRISDEDEISKIVSEALVYGKGIYDELVFASQKRDQTILSSLLGGETSENINELSSTITRAVMETGGVDIDEMEKELVENVEAFEGRWDFAADMPEGGRKRGINNKWKVGAGRILSSYYEREEIDALQEKAVEAEKSVEQANADLLSCKEKLEEAKARRERFSKVRSSISEAHSNKELYNSAKREYDEINSAYELWPDKKAQLEKAELLKDELDKSKTLEQYISVKEIIDETERLESEIESNGEVSEDDVKKARRLDSRLNSLENALKGINLSARVKKLGNADVQFRSSISGELIPVGPEPVDITESVDIIIPGIAEIKLAPKGTDIESVGRELAECREQLDTLLKENRAETLEELQAKQSRFADMSSKLQYSKTSLEFRLDGREWEELRAEAERIGSGSRDAEDIENDIQEFCGASVDTFIGSVGGEIKRYAEKYGSFDELKKTRAEKKDAVEKLLDKLSRVVSVPEEFSEVSDADAYDEELKKKIETLDEDLDWARTKLSSAERALSEKSAEALAEEYRKADDDFKKLKSEHAHWKHILEVFRDVRDSSKSNPMPDIEKSFGDYLSSVSAGRISLQELDEDLSGRITSGRFVLTEDILSEGTKDTIALAFRLALLNHLYPEGGCVAVFDDPFTDMDPERTAEACKLVQKFAENNQVIFVTCDEKYKSLLNGNLILM